MAPNRAKYHKWSSLFQLLLKENVNSKFYEENILWEILEIFWKRGHGNVFSKKFAIVNRPELRRVLTTFNLKDNFLNKYSGGHTSSVIRQKGEPQNGCLKERKHAKFSEKRIFLTPWYAHVHVSIRGQETFVSENLACFVFLKHPCWDLPFCLITNDFSLGWGFFHCLTKSKWLGTAV